MAVLAPIKNLGYRIRLLIKTVCICKNVIIMAHTNEQIIALFDELPLNEKITLVDVLKDNTTKSIRGLKHSEVENCPHCKSQLKIKHGKRGKLQKYKCKSCCRIYTSQTGTPMHNLHKVDKFEKYKLLMFEEDYLTIQSIATKVGISIKMAFD